MTDKTLDNDNLNEELPSAWSTSPARARRRTKHTVVSKEELTNLGDGDNDDDNDAYIDADDKNAKAEASSNSTPPKSRVAESLDMIRNMIPSTSSSPEKEAKTSLFSIASVTAMASRARKKISNNRNAQASPPPSSRPPQEQDNSPGTFGTLHVEVLQAYLNKGPANETTDSDGAPAYVLYYVLTFGSGRYESTMYRRTKNPKWEKKMEFAVNETDRRLSVQLMDGKSDALGGTVMGQVLPLSLISIAENQVNAHFPNSKQGGNGQSVSDSLAEYYKAPAGATTLAPGRSKWYDLVAPGSDGEVIGRIEMVVEYREDLVALLSRRELMEPENAPPQTFQFQKVKECAERMNALYNLYMTLLQLYKFVFRWRKPRFSLAWLCLSVFLCFHVDMEYFPCVPLGFMLWFLLYMLYRRATGAFYIEYMEERNMMKPERRIGTLRVAVVEGRNIGGAEAPRSQSLCVRVFYQPSGDDDDHDLGSEMKQDVKRYYIGSTKNVKGTPNPNFQIQGAQAVGGGNSVIGRMVPSAFSSERLQIPKQAIQGKKDATLHNVKEKWKHDGVTDPDTLKYPLLHPLNTFETAIQPWSTLQGSLIFEVYQDESYLMGYCTMPLGLLVDEKGHTGEQKLADMWHNLQLPEDKSGMSSVLTKFVGSSFGSYGMSTDSSLISSEDALGLGGGDESNRPSGPSGMLSTLGSAGSSALSAASAAMNAASSTASNLMGNKPTVDVGILKIRVQLTLPDDTAQFTDECKVNQEALEEMMKEGEEEGGILKRLVAAKHAAGRMQAIMERTADRMEKCKNLFTWANPYKTSIFFAGTLASFVASYFIPFRWLMLMGLISKFIDGYRFPDQKYGRMEIMGYNLILSLPTDADIKDSYQSLKSVHLKQVQDRAALNITLQALWMGDLYKQGERNPALKLRFVVVRNGRILWWKSKMHAVELGMRPRGQLVLIQERRKSVPDQIMDINHATSGSNIEFPLKAKDVRSDVGYFGMPREVENGIMSAVTGHHVINIEETDSAKTRRVVFACNDVDMMRAFVSALKQASIMNS